MKTKSIVFKAVLSRSTTDKIKSKLSSTEMAELVFDVYTTPKEFAALIEDWFDREFIIEVKER